MGEDAARPTTPEPGDVGAFPASPQTPGQAESRSAYARWKTMTRPAPDPAKSDEPFCSWWDEYQQLRAEGWTWRVAAYIAWAASPADRRWPARLSDLATQVLGLHNDRTIRKWRERRPKIDERVATLQVEPLLRHRRDVIEALVAVAKTPDPDAHRDRRMFLEMTGDYNPKGLQVSASAEASVVQYDLGELTDEELDELDRLGRRLAGGAGGAGAAPAD